MRLTLDHGILELKMSDVMDVRISGSRDLGFYVSRAPGIECAGTGGFGLNYPVHVGMP